jgi:hypothetical protein
MSGILAALAGIKTAIATAVDEYFNRTTLLLNTSSTNGAQNNTFLDSSTNNFTITRNGNTTQGTFTPFSHTGWSYYGPGSSQLSTVANPNLAFGTGAITFECWINTTSTSNMGMWGTTNEAAWTSNSYAFNYYNGDIILWNNSALWSIAVGTLHDGNWHHIAIVRSGTTWQVFADGVSKGTTTTEGSRDLGNNAWRVAIGQIEPSAGDTKFFIGYLSNMRVSNTAIYTSNFTPSTTPLTTTSQGVSSSNVKFLSLQSNRFIDNSTNAIALTVFGTPSVQAFSPFAPTAAYDTAVVGGSGYFDGSGDSLALGSSAAFAYGTGAITIQFWIYGTSNSSVQAWVTNGSNNLNIQRSSGGFYNVYDGTDRVSTTTVVSNQWNHIAFVRQSGGQTNLYVNGTSVLSWTSSVNYGNDTFLVSGSGSFPFTGYVSGLQVLKGTALYTSTFTPPTAPPTAVTNTQLLCNFTNSGIYDSTAKNVLETVGNAQVSTTQAKWGTTSMYFDGSSSSWLVAPFNRNLDISTGTPDWTLECWAYINSYSNSPYLFNKGGLAAAYYTNYCIYIASNGVAALTLGNNGGQSDYSFGSVSTGTWYHFAATRQGNTIRTFLNGTMVTNTTIGTTMTDNGQELYVGCLKNLTSNVLNGYIDDLRITKGYARYTATFTPPAAAFPLQ